ncbi:MAG: primosomal protein N' [Lautropia sp.]
MSTFADVLLDGPLAGRYAYRVPAGSTVAAGDWVAVPWGRIRRVGLVAGVRSSDAASPDPALDPQKIRDLDSVLTDLPPAPPGWLDFIEFAAGYYHGAAADLALGSVPKLLRVVPSARTRTRASDRLAAFAGATPAVLASLAAVTADPGACATGRASAATPVDPGGAPALNAAQRAILAALTPLVPAPPAAPTSPTPPASPTPPFSPTSPTPALPPTLLHGITGSGKTEIYLHWFAAQLARSPTAQVLLLVPEIGLTPALLTQLQRRFPDQPIAVLHSEMPDATRASHWLAAASGRARIVLGTRLAVLVPLPGLAAVVVDEEHDPSYKQQEGIRYSARDLAIARAARAGVPVVLGSATPSLETWHNAQAGRYRTLALTARASGAGLPAVRIVGVRGSRLRHGLSDAAVAAIGETLARGEQALLFLNRRGYAPVLSCEACGWLSRCDRCDAYRVLHRVGSRPHGGYRLICHHCAAEAAAPRACPQCGNQDLTPVGRGTQRLADGLAELFPTAAVGRLDRDVAKRRGAIAHFLAEAHAGRTDILVGTQMLAKGHDFERLTLVVVVDADAGLFAADFRAPERLFATLMQVSGRAGRHAPERATTLVQTRYPDHPLFASLVAHDYPGFAAAQLAERAASGLPPFAYQALLLAQARTMDVTVGFLAVARDRLLALAPPPTVTVCDPVPMPLAQLNNLSRAQLLVEAGARRPLHALLARWLPELDAAAAAIRGTVRWQLVVDPQEI